MQNHTQTSNKSSFFSYIQMEDKNKGLIQLHPDTQLIHRQKTNHLIGKLILSITYPLAENYVKNVCLNSWKCFKDFTVSAVSHNTFIFSFQEHHDCMHALLNVPWNVKGGLLILSPWIPGQKPEDFNFSFSPFWVQVHQLPPELMTPENGVKIGNVLGRFIYSERHMTGPSGMLPAREFLRLRVFLDIRKPLLTKYLVKRTGMSDFWIQFRYEELGVFCFKCGVIGSYHWFCEHPFGEASERYNTLLSVPSCSETPAIRVPQMFTIMKSSTPVSVLPKTTNGKLMIIEEESPVKTTDTSEKVSILKEPSDSGQEVGCLHEKANKEEEEKEIEEESLDPKLDTNGNVSTRVPEMNTMVKEPSRGLGQEILCFLKKVSEEEKDIEKESSKQMFDSDASFLTSVPHMNTMPMESAESGQEDNEKDEDSEKEDGEEESLDQMFDADENFPTWSGMQMLVLNGLATMVAQVWSRLRIWFGFENDREASY